MAAWNDNVEKQTVRRALSGDESAWAELVNTYNTYAYRLAWRVTFNEDDALDAAQETLMKLAGKLADFRGGGSLRSWVTTIAIREATTICRRRARLPVPVDPAMISWMAEQNCTTPAPAGEGLATDIDLQRHLIWMQRAMEQLSPQQRAILLLAVENDMGPAEIARELGLPANQVRSQQTRAIQRMREILKQQTEETMMKHDGKRRPE